MKYFYIFLAFFSINTAFSQNPNGDRGAGRPNGFANGPKIGRLYGRILDSESKKGLDYASVTLMVSRGKKDSVITGALTESNGDFNLTQLAFGRYKIKVTQMGYKEYSQMVTINPPDNVEQDLGDITLQIDTKQLNDVVVKAEKGTLQLGIDKKIFNVDKNITAAGGTAEDVLKNIPSVNIDIDGNAKMRNTSTQIYVGGRPTIMTLNQIPADQIESVELITNPSAKFEAATSGGILNIILKKNKKPGYNGMVSLMAGTGKRYSTMANLNVKEGKWNFSGFFNYNYNNNPTNGYSYRTNYVNGQITNYFNQTTKTIFNNPMLNSRIAIDYSINNRNTLTFAGSYNTGAWKPKSVQGYEILNPLKEKVESGERIADVINSFDNKTLQALWKKTYPKKGKELTADVQINLGKGGNGGGWTTTAFDKNGASVKNFPEYQDVVGSSTNNQATIQVDYVNPINDSTKLEMGVRSFNSNRLNDYYLYLVNKTDNTKKRNDFLSSSLDIQDQIQAAYVTYGSRLKSGWNYQGGLRFEYSDFVGKSKLDGTPFGYKYPNSSENILNSLFPAVFFSKKFANKGEFQMNFARKINRPNHMQIMPVVQNNDRQNVRQGNPKLQPEFINLAEMNYQRYFGENNWLCSVYLRYEQNPITSVVIPDPSDPSLLRFTFENGKTSRRYGIDNTFKLKFNKNFDLTTNVNIFNVLINTQTLSNQGWTWEGKMNLNYKIAKSWAFQFNVNNEGRRIIPQGYKKAITSADLALKYTFFQAGSLTFALNDMTNTRRDLSIFDQPFYFQENMRRRDMRHFKVTLQVPFGKADASMFKRGKDRGRQQQGNSEMDF